MSDERSARLALPYLYAGQAQKETTHNEALALLDIAVQAGVVAVGVNAPPTDPASGACWIVGMAPTGGWQGRGGAIAGWTVGGWRFVAPREGMRVWSAADSVEARYAGGAWVTGDVAATRLMIGGVRVVAGRQPAIAAPTGGTVIDAPGRAAIAAILAALIAHGLIGG